MGRLATRAQTQLSWHPTFESDETDHSDVDMDESIHIEQPGEEAKRQRAVGYKRLSRERLLGEAQEADSMAKWLCITLGPWQVERELSEIASSTVPRAVQAAMDKYQREEAEAQRARARMAQRERRVNELEELLASRQSATPRNGRTFCMDDAESLPRFELVELTVDKKSEASGSKPAMKLTTSHLQCLQRIATAKELRKEDVIGAEQMSPLEMPACARKRLRWPPRLCSDSCKT